MAWELIIWLLDVLENDFGEVDEAMFQDVERANELIFYILKIEKKDMNKVACHTSLGE
jgi:hypothetical protein